MAGPTTADVEALKRCIRFLLKYPQCIQSVERLEVIRKQVTCFSDSNFAGCVQSRGSASSCTYFYRRHLLKSTPPTQAVVSLSSAEAKFYAAVKAAAAGIGCVSMLRDLGVVLQQQEVGVRATALTTPASRSSWTQQQAVPLQCEEVLDASGTLHSDSVVVAPRYQR